MSLGQIQAQRQLLLDGLGVKICKVAHVIEGSRCQLGAHLVSADGKCELRFAVWRLVSERSLRFAQRKLRGGCGAHEDDWWMVGRDGDGRLVNY